jgi:ribonuclease BN (tRNA processing enzyme)
MDAIVLGSGGWIPTSRRETCCALIRDGSQALVIDAGTGIQRLVENRELLRGVESVDIVLTHFHLDHVVGLSYLPALGLPEPPVVWAAGRTLADLSAESLLGRLLGAPFFSAPLSDIARAVREIETDKFEIGSFAIATRVQERHAEPTLAVRIGDALTYCTDTAPDPGNVGFAAGSRVLLHEAWYAQATSDDGNHSAGGDAARIARDAGVERLVLIHVNPLQDSDDALAESAHAEFAGAEVAVDLSPIPLGGRL